LSDGTTVVGGLPVPADGGKTRKAKKK